MRAIIDALRWYPRTCVWEITARCNFRCLHCASSLGPDTARGKELDASRSLELCEELAALGCEYAVLSGGEPLLRPDWSALAQRLYGLGVRVGMISNGWRVTDDTVRTMIASGVSVLAISVDGLALTHDRIRCRDGSFAAAVRALARARAGGLRIHVVTHINRLNRAELPELRRHLASLGVATWLLQLSAPLGRLREHRELVLEPAELPALADWLVEARQSSPPEIAAGDNVGYYARWERPLRCRADGGSLGFWCGCSAGCFNLGIEANGDVKGCLSLQSSEFVEGNVASQRLRDIWERRGAFAYTRNFHQANLSGFCATCDYGEICRGGCTFMSVAATGKPGDNPYCLHRLAHEP